MKKTVVINVVGLTPRLIGPHTPFIKNFLEKGGMASITPVLPAVTCSAQATYLTGKWPTEHGIVGNGWYFQDECEIKFWRQSNKFIECDKIWHRLKKQDANFTCANLFWWYNMYSEADYSVTPRPNYLADGRKIPDCYSHPPELRDSLQEALGTFPLFHFWGPNADIKSSRWIADATLITDALYDPTLTLVYLPHLDYALQKHGPDLEAVKKELGEIDAEVRKLVTYYEARESHVILISEYGITAVHRPVHLNRVLRAEGYLAIREERGLELLDAGASKAFAVADHQLAHIYLNDSSLKDAIKTRLQQVPGVERVLADAEITAAGLAHPRCGDLVVVADKDSWFTYYFWEDDAKAPDYARMVDIHKKPGYDPVEMFTDPKDPWVMPKIIWKLLKKKMGFRTVLDIIPLNANLVKGSHGRIPEDVQDRPLLATNAPSLLDQDRIEAIEVFSLLEKHVLNQSL